MAVAVRLIGCAALQIHRLQQCVSRWRPQRARVPASSSQHTPAACTTAAVQSRTHTHTHTCSMIVCEAVGCSDSAIETACTSHCVSAASLVHGVARASVRCTWRAAAERCTRPLSCMRSQSPNRMHLSFRAALCLSVCLSVCLSSSFAVQCVTAT